MKCLQIKGNRFTLLLFVFFLFPNLGIAQNNGSLYSDKIVTGTHIYVVTNRAQNRSSHKLQFGNTVTQESSLSYIKATIQQSDSLELNKMDSISFISEMCTIKGDWIVFVHGDGKTINKAILRAFDIQYLYEVNVIVFSWPSKDSCLNGSKNFKRSQANVLKSQNHFEQLLRFSARFKDDNPAFKNNQKLSMFCHSLGNYHLEIFAKTALDTLKKKKVFDNLILNAAAVNQKNHKQWIEKLKIQQQIFITSNKQDFNLKGVRIFTKGGRQLGEVIRHPLASNAIYVQFNKSVGFRVPTSSTHTYFIGEIPDNNSSVYSFYYRILHGNSINFLNKDNFIKRKDNLGYEIN